MSTHFGQDGAMSSVAMINMFVLVWIRVHNAINVNLVIEVLQNTQVLGWRVCSEGIKCLLI